MKKKEINYYVIGGQYQSYNHGGARTLLGAKRLAGKCWEYWDNWSGWHCPSVYKAEDCELKENFFGRDYYPKEYAVPIAFFDVYTNRWESDVDLFW